MITLIDRLDDMFSQMDAMLSYPLSRTPQFRNHGLKSIIGRPHNLITKKDKDGNITGYALEVVYTPFKKAEVEVNVLDGVLTVRCGSENKEKDEGMVYCGISHQSYEFKLPLAEDVDQSAITAKAEDGILYIDLPKKVVAEAKDDPLKITVQ